jgi:hypothetical protein
VRSQIGTLERSAVKHIAALRSFILFNVLRKDFIVAVGDYFRLTAIWRNSADSAHAVNRFHFEQRTALILDTPEEDLVEAFTLNMLAEYIALVTSLLTLDTIFVGQGPGFETSYAVGNFGQGGQLTGEALPPRTSASITYKTALLSRRGRGRIYLPPANEASSLGGTVGSSYQSALNSLIDGWEAMDTETVNHAGWTPIMWSEADQTKRTITQFSAAIRWRSQRDRSDLY